MDPHAHTAGPGNGGPKSRSDFVRLRREAASAVGRNFARSAAALALLLAACGPHGGSRSPSHAWAGRVDTVGDTITVTTDSGFADRAAPIVVDSVAQLSHGVAFTRPDVIVRMSGGELLVSDRSRVVRIGPDGSDEGTVGRPGEGPGEFRDAAGLGVLPGDTILVLDDALRRVNWISPAGNSLRTARVPDGLFSRGIVGDGVRIPRTGTLVWGGLGRITPAQPSPYVVRVAAAGSDSVLQLAELPGPTFDLADGNLTRRDLFDRWPVIAVASDGRVAYADLLEYCVMIDSTGARWQWRICRSYPRVPATDPVRHPDLDAVAERTGMSAAMRESFQTQIDRVSVGDRHPALSELRFDGDGRLWVRIVDSAQAGVHPWMMQQDVSLRPPRFIWEVYDRDGRRAERVELPSVFDPREFAGDTVWGVLELESGDQVVGRAVDHPTAEAASRRREAKPCGLGDRDVAGIANAIEAWGVDMGRDSRTNIAYPRGPKSRNDFLPLRREAASAVGSGLALLLAACGKPDRPATAASTTIDTLASVETAPLQSPSGGVVLPDGRIAVVDAKAERVFILGGDSVETVGRPGAGPGELRFPWRVTLLGDTLAVSSYGTGRLDLFALDGSSRGSRPLPQGFQSQEVTPVRGDTMLMTTGGRDSTLVQRLAGDSVTARYGAPVVPPTDIWDFGAIKQEIRDGHVPAAMRNIDASGTGPRRRGLAGAADRGAGGAVRGGRSAARCGDDAGFRGRADAAPVLRGERKAPAQPAGSVRAGVGCRGRCARPVGAAAAA